MNDVSSKSPSHEHDDDHDDLEPKVWTVAIFVAAFGLYWSGNTKIAIAFCCIGVLYMVSGSFFHELSENDKLRIEYNIYSAEDGLADYDKRRTNPSKKSSGPDAKEQPSLRIAALALLPALAKKTSTLRNKIDLLKGSSSSTKEEDSAALILLAKTSQTTAYLALRDFPDDDEVIMASFALLALNSKEATVRQRHFEQADVFGLDVIVQSMQRALDRSKEYTDPSKEHLAAELQRKGCLLIGALSDSDSTLAALAVQEGGLDVIAQALSWFRCHAELVNWGLWALFNLCYEHSDNKLALLEHAPLIVECMANCCKENIAVARHGTALVFDLLRDASSSTIGADRLRHTGEKLMSVGLEQVMRDVTETYPDASDIQMMGQEILSKITWEKP